MGITKAECKRVALETFLEIAKTGPAAERLSAAQSLFFYAIPPTPYPYMPPPMPAATPQPGDLDEAETEE